MKKILTNASILVTVLLSSACSGWSGQNIKSASGKTDSSLPDTSKLKSDLNTLETNASNMAERKLPDTTALKAAGADVLNHTADRLSDSGIDKMGGDNPDPGVVEAKKIMKKMMDSLGINKTQLGDMRKSAEKLAADKH